MSRTVLSPIIEQLERRLAKTFDARVGMRATKLGYEIMLEEYRRAFYRQPGEYLVWVHNIAPRHLFYAMNNVVVFGVTTYTNMLGRMPIAREAINIAEGWGFSKDICSRDRAFAAEALLGQLPKPDLFVTSTNVCESFKLMEYFHEHLGVPYFLVENPLTDDEEGLRWLVEQLEELVRFTEALTHQKLDQARLAQVIENDMRAQELLKEILELCKATPSPLKGKDALRMNSIMRQFGCNAKVGTYLEAVRAEVKERVAKGKGVTPNERYRILWLQTQPSYEDLFDFLEKEFGAVIALAELATHRCGDSGTAGMVRDPSLSPLEAFAKAMIGHMWKGPVEGRIAPILEWARDYRIDACIHFSHWGCRTTTNSAQIIKDALQRELSIPTLILEGDYHDASNYSDEQTKNRIRAFMETL